MADRPWLAGYAKGVPADVDWQVHPSVAHMFERAVARYGDHPAFSNLGRTLSYADVGRLSRDFAGYLQHDLGMVRGERLAIMLPNVLHYPVVLFGAFLAGLAVVNVNPQFTARELRYQLLDSGARDIVVLENFAHTVQAVADECALRRVITCRLGDLHSPVMGWITNFVVRHVKHLVPRWSLSDAIDFSHVLRMRRGSVLRPVDLTADDIAFLQYTSGTRAATWACPIRPPRSTSGTTKGPHCRRARSARSVPAVRR